MSAKGSSSTNKRPAILFYPGDWLRDTALRSVSIDARGLWIDMICFMHTCIPYGHLKVNHKVIHAVNLSVMVGVNLEKTERLLQELIEAGVCGVAEDGSYFSTRMVRDEEIRLKRASGGRLGGNPALKKSSGKFPKLEKKDNHKDNHEGYPLLENENTTTNTVNNEGNNLNNNTDNILVVVDEVNLMDNHNGYPWGDYKISDSNENLLHPIEVCLKNYLENKQYERTKESHLFQLHLDANPAEAVRKLSLWAHAFNRGLINDGVFKKTFVGDIGSWTKHFKSWVKRVRDKRPNVDPEILFTHKDIDSQNVIKNNSSENGHKVMSGNAPLEEQEKKYKRRERE